MDSFIDEISNIKEFNNQTLEKLSHFVWEVDKSGKILDFHCENENFKKQLREKLVGRPFLNILKNRLKNKTIEHLKQLLNQSEPIVNYSIELEKTQNRYNNALINIIPIHKNNGVVDTFKIVITPVNSVLDKQINIFESELAKISKDLLFSLDINNEYQILKANVKQISKILSYSAKNIIGKSLWEFIHPKDKTLLYEKLNQNTTVQDSIEVRIKSQKGDFKWFEVKTIKKNRNHGINTCVLILGDISKRKQLEKQIRIDEERLKSISDSVPEIRYWKLLQPKQSMSAVEKSREMIEVIINTIPQLIYWKDKNLKYLGANQKFLNMNEMKEINEIFGKTDRDLKWTSNFKNIDEIKRKEEEIINSDSAQYHSIESFRKRSGQKIWFDINRIPLHDTRGNVEGILTTYEDITQRKLSEQKIKQSEKKYRNMINNLDLGFFRVNAEGIIHDHNPKLCNIFGYERNTNMVGESAYVLWENEQELRNYINTLMKVGASRNILYGARKRNGEKIIIQVDSHIILDNTTEDIEIEGTIFDVTEKINLERKLKESEEKYRSLVNNISDAIFELNLDGDITYVSPQVKELFGYKHNELINKNALQFITEEDRNILKNAMEKAINTNKLVSIEFGIEHKEGKKIISSGRGGIVEIHGNKRFIGIMRDVTKQKEAEKKLKESREKYRLITENVNDLISVINERLRYEYINEEIHKKVLGYDSEDLVGSSALHFIHPDDREHSFRALKNGKVMGKGGAELRFKHKDGHYIWLEVKGQGFTNDKGEFKGYMIGRDITERKKAERRIKESEEKLKKLNKQLERKVEERTRKLRESEKAYRDMINNLDVGFFKTELNEPIKIYNRAFNNILGYSPTKSFRGKTIKSFFFKESEYRDYNRLLLRNGSIRNFIAKFKDKNESELVVQINAHLIDSPETEKREVEGTFIDITEKFRLEQKLKESEKSLREQNIELKKLDQLKNDFITMAAHELKTPLISIGGYIDLILLREEKLKDEIRDELLRVLTNTKRLEAYIDQLMDVMKIDAKKMDFDFKKANVYEIINESLNTLHYQIRKKDINIQVDVDPNLELVVDSFRISQVFSNLLSNAVKFTDQNGNITISSIRKEKEYLFKVKDDGRGLEKDEMDLLFEKFVSLKKDLEKFSRGSGLGLYISKGIIYGHNGEIWVESEGKNKGSTFNFTIPLSKDK
ncbi:MAG: putative Signal transduction histidine kinase [Promethearchaeota archaeon]|nr:MAG: putative Signal transduction histidine kinase [Candidatus Lokiarchaeota archaeon]